MDNPSIFIGSSSEGLRVAEAVKSQLTSNLTSKIGPIGEIKIWTEGVFEVNQSFLDSVIQAANLFDFAILCLTPDDVTKMRGRKKYSPRDNVLFELGLFMGRLGRKRAFIVADETVGILSDFGGIKITKYKQPTNGDYQEAVADACRVLCESINKATKQSGLSFLPSTALAIGYFENFILKVRDALIEEKNVSIDEVPIQYSEFELSILIPRKLSVLEPGNLKKRAKRLRQVTLNTSFRNFPFYMLSDFEPSTDKMLSLIDIPTTLRASEKVIDLILRRDTIGPSDERDRLEIREIANFKLALEHLTDHQSSIHINWLGKGE